MRAYGEMSVWYQRYNLWDQNGWKEQSTVYEQRDTSVPRKHHAHHLITEIEATRVQLKPETYIDVE